MVNLIRITEPTDIRLQKLIPLYKEAFPEEERRNIEQLERLIREKTEMYFNAIETDGVLAGLFIYWDMQDFYYLEHLAVFTSMRNLKVGQQVLDYIAEHLDGTRLLEVEPTTDEMTTRRVNYYVVTGMRFSTRRTCSLLTMKTLKLVIFGLWVAGNPIVYKSS